MLFFFYGMLVEMPGDEVSFTLNLFPDGYSIGKPLEVCYEQLLTLGS